MKRLLCPLLLALHTLPLQAAEAPLAALPDDPADAQVRIQTSMGEIALELFPQGAPETVANFLGLAEGTKPFLDPLSGQQVTRPFYDGLTFHRVIDGFIIQGGDPLGTGEGGPGYAIPDEINASSLGLDMMPLLQADGFPHPYLGIEDQADFQAAVLRPLYAKLGIDSESELEGRLEEVDSTLRSMNLKQNYENQGYRFSDSLLSRTPLRGVIAMANAGPNTAGSQFFITLADTPWLTGRYTVFGRVTSGMDVVDRIGKVPVDARDRPLQPVTILSIRPLRPASIE